MRCLNSPGGWRDCEMRVGMLDLGGSWARAVLLGCLNDLVGGTTLYGRWMSVRELSFMACVLHQLRLGGDPGYVLCVARRGWKPLLNGRWKTWGDDSNGWFAVHAHASWCQCKKSGSDHLIVGCGSNCLYHAEEHAEESSSCGPLQWFQ
jgi:hypothetical protein